MGGVDTRSAADSGQRGAVAKMTADEVERLSRPSAQLRGAARNIGVADAVKSEAPDAFVQPTSWAGIGISLRRERAVKRGVEHRHLRNVLPQHRLRGIDAFYLQPIVLRSEFSQAAEP